MYYSRAMPPVGSWTSVSPEVQFRPSKLGLDQPEVANSVIARFLEENNYANSGMAYGTFGVDLEDVGSSYQLAWRLLGFYVDCAYEYVESPDDDYWYQRKFQRQLSHSDSGDDFGCTRLALYGVYVDPDYEGGGFGEYQYYDKDADTWTCYDDDGCRDYMDCHLPDTNWQLAGVFKIGNVSSGDGFMEQLFKHEGVCIMSKDEYEVTDEGRESLPNYCKDTGEVDWVGNVIYAHSKPGKSGSITIGLYTDIYCTIEYTGVKVDPFTVTGIDEDFMEEFNSALDHFKICQPCVAYNVSAADDDFYCYDEAGYENCNQCMKFAIKAYSHSASQSDINLALHQQTLVGFELNGQTVGSGGIGRSETDQVSKITDQLNSGFEQLSAFESKISRDMYSSGSKSFPFMYSLVAFIVSTYFLMTMVKHRGKLPHELNNEFADSLLGDSSGGRKKTFFYNILLSSVALVDRGIDTTFEAIDKAIVGCLNTLQKKTTGDKKRFAGVSSRIQSTASADCYESPDEPLQPRHHSRSRSRSQSRGRSEKHNDDQQWQGTRRGSSGRRLPSPERGRSPSPAGKRSSILSRHLEKTELQ